MKIEAQPTTSTMAEAVQAKAETRLLLEENGKLREALVHARQCIDADNLIGAHNTLTNALNGMIPKYDVGELITLLNEAVNKLKNLRAKYDDLEKERDALRTKNEKLKAALRPFAELFSFPDDLGLEDSPGEKE